MLDNIVIYSVVPQNNDATINLALELAKKFNSKITFLKCVHKEIPRFALFQTGSEKKKEEELVKKAKDELKEFESLAKKDDISVKTKTVLSESISEYITKYVENEKVDLLIADSIPPQDIQSRDHKETINRIYYHVSCPILTLK